MSSIPTTSSPAREQWSGQLGFLMAAIGSAIGLGIIWRGFFAGVNFHPTVQGLPTQER